MPNETPQHPDSGIILDVMPSSGALVVTPTALIDARAVGPEPRTGENVLSLDPVQPRAIQDAPAASPGAITAVTLPAIYKEYVVKAPVIGRVYPKGD